MPDANVDHRKVVALFRDATAFEDAANALQSAGLDRSQLSVVSRESLVAGGVPDHEADLVEAARRGQGHQTAVTSDTDVRQMRTMVSSTAGATAASAGAAIAMVTGAGAVLAIAVAAASGLAAGGGVARAVGGVASRQDVERVRDALGRGSIILLAVARNEDEAQRVTAMLQRFTTAVSGGRAAEPA